jgi:hypothetical protein
MKLVMPLLIFSGNYAGNHKGYITRLYQQYTCAIVAIATIALSILVGCSKSSRPALEVNSNLQSKVKERVYFFPTRQLPPPPVYGRLMSVRPPEPLPAKQYSGNTGPQLNPIIHLEIEDATIYEITKVLAESHRYSFYCSSLVGQNKISLNRMGTIDELAKYIEDVAPVRVIVDHNLREVRDLRKKKSGNRSPKLP